MSRMASHCFIMSRLVSLVHARGPGQLHEAFVDSMIKKAQMKKNSD